MEKKSQIWIGNKATGKNVMEKKSQICIGNKVTGIKSQKITS